MNLVAEERVFWVKVFKKLTPQEEVEKRIVVRTLLRLLGKSAHRVPLYPKKECSSCGRAYAHKVFDRHHFVCKRRKREKQFTVDAEILKRIELE